MVYRPINKNVSNHINQGKGIKVTDMKFHQTNCNRINGIFGSDLILGRKNQWLYTVFIQNLTGLYRFILLSRSFFLL